MVQWFRLGAFTAIGLGSVPVGETQILQAVQQCGKKKRKEGGFLIAACEPTIILKFN